MKVRVHVTLKPGVLDVQGKAVGSALRSLGYEGADNVRQGKFFTFDLAGHDRAAAQRQVDEMCRKLLANTVIEDYRFDLDLDLGGDARGDADADADADAEKAGGNAGAGPQR